MWQKILRSDVKKQMGIYLHPSAAGFADILKGGFYVDKTGLLVYTNQVMETSRKLTCFSRPRRFGYEGEILLVGINYSVKTKKHTCKIIRYDRQAKRDHVSY